MHANHGQILVMLVIRLELVEEQLENKYVEKSEEEELDQHDDVGLEKTDVSQHKNETAEENHADGQKSGS
jgi:hypothetical protein